jgi:hypothetical protein
MDTDVAEKTRTAAPDVDEPEAVDETPAEPRNLELGTLAVLGVVWLGVTLRLADSLIAAHRNDPDQMASAISLALPTIVYASLLAGAAVGLASTLLRRFGPARLRLLLQALVGAAAGAVLGLITVVLILLRYGSASSTVVLAVTVGAAALIGGGAAALPRPILTAGITSTLELFVIGVLAGLFQSPLKSLFGATDDPNSQLQAASTLSIVTAVVQGLVAALTAYFYLRRRFDERRWPAYAAAGAVPGVLLLVGLGLSVIGGSGLSNLSGELSDADRMVRDLVSGAGLNQALTVLFVGTVGAMIAIGRTMRRVVDEDDSID